jgi:DNA-binding XRE family transcriptional regulator
VGLETVDRKAMLMRNRPPMGKKIETLAWENLLNNSRGVLAENVRELRSKRNLSQERLALEAGVDRTLVSKIERGVANPSLQVLSKICVILGVPISHLFNEGHARSSG